MLQLYPRNQIDFTWNGEPIKHTYDEHVVRDEGWYLNFKVLLDRENDYKKLKKGMVVKGWTMDGEQAFRIWDITKGHGFLEIEALHLIYDLDTKMTNPVHVNNGALNVALTQFKNGLPNEMGPFIFSTGITKQRTYNTEDAERANDKYNAMDVFMDGAHSIVGTWEAELLVNNWDIRLVESVGNRTSALLYEKKNISEFEDVESNKNIITRIYAQSTYTPEREEGADEEPQEVHLSVVVESPLINDYEQVHEAIYINNDARTNQELSQWAMRKFTYEKVDLPERTIKVSTNIIDGTEIKYGDYLVLKYLTHDVEEEIRCVGYDVNPVTKDIYEVNLGTNKLSMQGSIGGTVQDLTESQLNNEMAKVAERVTKVIMSSNGFNRIAYGPEPVPSPIEGDLWYEYQFDTPNTVTLKIWKDGMWVILLDDFMQERLKEKMEEVESQAEELTKGIEASDQKADEAKEDAGLAKSASEAAEVIAQQAQAEAESANTNSSEALEKAILAGTDAETAKQNALDAVGQASTAKQDASNALGQAGEAVIKANDAIGKANQIPQDIQNEIESKGLVSGSWVESHVDDVTGEINYALSEVSGSIPTVILGVTWDKSESPILTRTDYVEEYANLTDYLLKTNEIDFDIDGLDGRMSTVETNKLDSAEFTSFKTNDYAVTVEGFTTALTEKLDEETFSTFKTNEFDVTVNGINGSIESLQTDKLDSTDFNTFKSNEYEVTVDGLRMDLSSVSGSIPTIVMGVEWDKSQNPELTRTDYLEYDNPNLYSPNFIMGVRWDKTDSPKLYRTDDTGGLDDYEYSQQTAQFISDISGLSGRVESVETNKLGANEFNSFKTNTYDVDLSGIRTNITSLEESKLGSDEFSTFKTNVFDVSVSGLSGRIGTVETEKLDSETYETFKTNTYDVDVSGLQSRMSSVETKKLDSGTFNTFKDTTYTNTIQGITGNISSLQQDKLDNQDFNSFKQNEYEVTVDGLKMGLTDVQGSFPTIVLGVEWDKSSEPSLERTDFSVGYADSDEFTALQADYEFTKSSWSTRLSQIENTDYATKTWSNQTFATPQSVTTQLQSYAKTTDLNGLATESYVGSKLSATAGAIRTEMTKVEGKIDNLEIGGRNYAKGTSKEFTYVTVSLYSGSLIDGGTTSQNVYTLEELGAQAGDTMTVSMYVGESKEGYGGGFRIDDQGGQNKYSTYKVVKNGYVSETFTILKGSTEIRLYTAAYGESGASGNFRLPVKELKFEKGSVATDWSPAPEDMATSQQVSSIEQKANSIQALVGTTNDSVARAVMTSSLWETEVSKVIDDELEQEYKTVTSKVNVVDGGKDINNGEGTGEGRYFYFNNSDGVVEGTLSRNATYTLEFSTQSFDNKGNAITLQVKPYGTTEWEPIVTGQMTAGKQISTFTFENNVFASSVSDYRLLIRSANGENVPYIWGFKLYKEVEVEVPIEGTNTGAISSKITQLYNMINLSILGKDGALSRIAIGEDGIQIDGKLLHITAKTFIDNAVIKSAMIETLDAGKITTGELNASLIRVVNLDANSIAGNEASFIRAMFSGTKSTLQITGSGVSILDNLGRSSTYLDSSGIEFSRQGVNLGKLEYVTNVADSGDLYNMHGFSMRPNRNSYFGVSYFPTSSATSSIRRFAVSGRTGNVYISGLIKPSEQQIYGINITWGSITGRGTNVRIMNHNQTGGIQINSGDLAYLTSGGWRSLNDKLG